MPLREARAQWLEKVAIDEHSRTAFTYKFKSLFGRTPRLESDTAFQRVKFSFPFWERELMKDAVAGEWALCKRLVDDQQDFVEARGPIPLKTHLKDLRTLARAGEAREPAEAAREQAAALCVTPELLELNLLPSARRPGKLRTHE